MAGIGGGWGDVAGDDKWWLEGEGVVIHCK